MALPTFVAAGTPGSGTGNLTPGLPSGWQADDIFLLHIETANEPPTSITGWTQLPDSPQGSGVGGGIGSYALSVWWRRATASETAPTITDPGDHGESVITAYRGVRTSDPPYDVTNGNNDGGTESTSVVIPGDTTTVADCLVVASVAGHEDATFDSWANADLANVAERVDTNLTGPGNDGSLAVATGEKATAGAFGNTTATASAGIRQAHHVVALIGASATPTTETVSHTTDAVLEVGPTTATVTHTTDASLWGQGIEVSHTTDAILPSEFPGGLPSNAVIAYYDAETLSGADNDPVSSWPDSGPIGQAALAQATSTKQPTIQDVGGFRWVEGDGTDDFLDNGGLASTYTGDFGFIIVLETDVDESNVAGSICLMATAGVPNKHILGWDNGQWVVMSSDGSGGAHHHGGTRDFSAVPYRTVMTQLVRDAGEHKLWDGTELAINETESDPQGDPLNDLTALKLFAREDDSRWANVRIAKFLVVDLTETDETGLLAARDELITTYLLVVGSETHTTDAVLRASDQKTHTTDAVIQASVEVSHGADAKLIRTPPTGLATDEIGVIGHSNVGSFVSYYRTISSNDWLVMGPQGGLDAVVWGDPTDPGHDAAWDKIADEEPVGGYRAIWVMLGYLAAYDGVYDQTDFEAWVDHILAKIASDYPTVEYVWWSPMNTYFTADHGDGDAFDLIALDPWGTNPQGVTVHGSNREVSEWSWNATEYAVTAGADDYGPWINLTAENTAADGRHPSESPDDPAPNGQTHGGDILLAFFEGASAVLHTTDLVLRANVQVVHTSDVVLQVTGTAAHDTDATLRATEARSQTTDAVLLGEQTATFNTDAVVLDHSIRDHQLDAVLRAENSPCAHQVDAVLRGEGETDHTVDARLQRRAELSHGTDVVIQAEVVVDHEVDAHLLAAFDYSHTTDAVVIVPPEAGTVTHTTDAKVGVPVEVSHDTDAVVVEQHAIDHGTDAILEAAGAETHSTDFRLISASSVESTSDAVLQAVQGLTQGLDAVLRGTQALNHTTEVLLQARAETNHETDGVLVAGTQLGHDTDVLLVAALAVGHEVDAHLVTRLDTDHTTDFVIEARPVLGHTTDALINSDTASTHETDAVLFAEGLTVVHTTDAVVQASQEQFHTTDLLVMTRASENHDTDAVLLVPSSILHTTDSVILTEARKEHFTDAVLLEVVTVENLSHGTDMLLVATMSWTHTSDAVLLAESQLSHSADVLVTLTTVQEHTTDAHLQKVRDESHTTDALIVPVGWNQKFISIRSSAKPMTSSSVERSSGVRSVEQGMEISSEEQGD